MGIKLVNDGVNTIAYDGLQNVCQYLTDKRNSLSRHALPSVLTDDEKEAMSSVYSLEDKIHMELLRVTDPSAKLSNEQIELLNCMIYEAASDPTTRRIYREVGQITNFIKIQSQSPL